MSNNSIDGMTTEQLIKTLASALNSTNVVLIGAMNELKEATDQTELGAGLLFPKPLAFTDIKALQTMNINFLADIEKAGLL